MSYIWFSAVLTLEKAELLTRHFDERAPPNAGARFMIDPGNPGAEFPPLYSRWLAELLPGPIPRETRATCNDCAMCAPDGHQDGAEKEYFDPAIKCCTYVPEIHNFLAGGVLSDDDPSAQPGRATVEKRIRTGVAVTPLGLKQPAVFSLLYDNGASAFGRSRGLRCPHYIEDGGRCGVWRHRESTCSTWFCKHVRGSVGYRFWRESLHRLLLVVEKDLARWAVLQLDLDLEALRNLVFTPGWRSQPEQVTAESIDNRVDRDSYSAIWGNWVGREVEFYVECARLVDALSWKEVLEIAGPEARAFARLTLDAYNNLISDQLPGALKTGSVQLVQLRHDMTRVSAYSLYDPIDIPRIVMESLHYFDGRPVPDAVGAIAAEKGVVLDQSLVLKMVDFGVLVPTE